MFTKEEIERDERAHRFFMEIENNAAAYHDWFLVVGQSKEYAERLFGTEFSD